MFQNARIKLTLWYVVIIMAISFLFSFAMYTLIAREIDRFSRLQMFRVQRGFMEYNLLPPDDFEEDLAAEAKDRLIVNLIELNILIMVLSGGAAYVLAGKTLNPIKEMVDSQSRFISDASHELRTPLTSLKSSMEVYLRNDHPKISDANELVKSNLEDIERMASLTNSLLKLSQQPLPFYQVQTNKLALAPVLEAAVKQVSNLAKEKNIGIEIQPTDYSVWGDSQRLQELFVILLDNAIKYSKDGTIRIKADRHDGFVQVHVTDEGIGISQADVMHIFDRFYRADTTRSSSNVSGYGLGLAIAQQIVTSHKGRIDVHSEVGKGSTFTVLLPLAFS